MSAAFSFEVWKGDRFTEAKHHTCQKCEDEWDCVPCLGPSHLTSFTLQLLLPRPRPSSTPAPLSCPGASEVKHVSGAWDEAREREMSQMNTCQVMSSPVSADHWPQLFRCNEAHCAAPVWRRLSSHKCSGEQALYSQGVYNSLVMKPAEVKRGRQDISSRACFHTVWQRAKDSRWRISSFLIAQRFWHSSVCVCVIQILPTYQDS